MFGAIRLLLDRRFQRTRSGLRWRSRWTAESSRRAVITTTEAEKASAILRAEGLQQSAIIAAEGQKQSAISVLSDRRRHAFASRLRRTRPPRRSLLFPASVDQEEQPLADIRKLIDRVAGRCGWRSGELNARTFRHTHTAARLQTLDHGARP